MFNICPCVEKQYHKIVALVFFVLFFFFPTKFVSAATYYWVGGSTNNLVSNPANWNTSEGACSDSGNATLPSTTDSVLFTSSCVNDATFDTDFTVSVFTLLGGYTGKVTVDNSDLTVTTQLRLYTGDMTITNGAKLTAPPGSSGFIIGYSGQSTLKVTGVGSQLLQTISGDSRVRIGNITGSHGTLIIENGATATTGNLYASYGVGTQATITVNGSGTTWEAGTSGGLGYLGRAGDATMTISNGAVVSSGNTPLQIGGLAGSTGNLTITGSGSKLNLTNGGCNLRIGYAGTGSVTIANGGELNVNTAPNGKITLADQAGSQGTITVNSPNTLDQVSSYLGIFTGSGAANHPPLTPQNLYGTDSSTDEISWVWDSLSNATGYKVYTASNSNLLTTINTNTTTWRQEDLDEDTNYSVYVRGFNNYGTGYASSSAVKSTNEKHESDDSSDNDNGDEDNESPTPTPTPVITPYTSTSYLTVSDTPTPTPCVNCNSDKKIKDNTPAKQNNSSSNDKNVVEEGKNTVILRFEENGKPLVGFKVYLQHSETSVGVVFSKVLASHKVYEAVTNEKGEAKFENVEKGVYFAKIKKGIKEVYFKVNVTSENESLKVPIDVSSDKPVKQNFISNYLFIPAFLLLIGLSVYALFLKQK